jgi:hypothetical protein
MFAKVLKYNPYHDATGAFSSRDKAGFVSTGPKFAKSNAKDKERSTRIKTKVIPSRENEKQRAKLQTYMDGFTKNLKNPKEKAYAEARIKQMINGQSRPSGMSGMHGLEKRRAIQYEALVYKIFTAGRVKIDV